MSVLKGRAADPDPCVWPDSDSYFEKVKIMILAIPMVPDPDPVLILNTDIQNFTQVELLSTSLP